MDKFSFVWQKIVDTKETKQNHKKIEKKVQGFIL